MRQILHLQHHRHTGKLLHHRHTSYRSLAVIFVISGFFIIGLNIASHAAADQFGVSAMVMAPIPTTSPIISSPADATTVKDGSLLVTGSCPLITPEVVVSISIDNTLAGTAACDSNNDFSMPVAVTSGTHKITAGAITISGQKGPVSGPVMITALNAKPQPTIAIVASQSFIYADNKDITWTGNISTDTQGNGHIHVDWGDGSTSDYTVQPGTVSFNHRYAVLASHNILIDAADARGNSVFEQYGAVTYTAYTAPILTNTQRQTPYFETSTVLGLYGLYVTTLSVMGIVWLEAKHAARQHGIA